MKALCYFVCETTLKLKKGIEVETNEESFKNTRCAFVCAPAVLVRHDGLCRRNKRTGLRCRQLLDGKQRRAFGRALGSSGDIGGIGVIGGIGTGECRTGNLRHREFQHGIFRRIGCN